MARFCHSEVGAAVLIYSILQSSPIYIHFYHQIRTVPDDPTSYKIAHTGILHSSVSPSVWNFFTLHVFLLLARAICGCVYETSVMHSPLIRVAEAQLSKLKSISSEAVLF